MTEVRERLKMIGERVKGRFDAEKRVLTFDEYVDLVAQHPVRHTRDAARYVRDCFDHFGTTDVDHAGGKVSRFRLFDQQFEEDGPPTGDSTRRRHDHLVGHEAVQQEVYDILHSFVREGRANRLILLHGPNGSAKSTFAACILRALEHYSTLEEGPLYRFSWIFPRGRDGKTMGFGSTDDLTSSRANESFAHLADAQVDVKLRSEAREHPLLLLPLRERRELVLAVYRAKGISDAAPDWVWSGELGHKNRQILEALLTAYRGDLKRVLHHVQVERYYVSRRYRTGAVTIGPQMAVDASERQITTDESLRALPASLSALMLFEPYGELVDGQGGMIEYSDLLKRPLDAWKYLLTAIETGEVSLPMSNLPLNSVLIASSNELHLHAFREHPEFNSFRGRIRLVRLPYLLDFERERGIYDAQIVPQVRCHVAPHGTHVAALWAVLTRLRRSQADRYADSALGRIAADLTPLEKARLYALGECPRRLAGDQAKILRASIPEVLREWDSAPVYEGLTGASPREIRLILLDAAQDPKHACLSPLGVLERIEAFCAKGDYEFLRESADRGYQDPRAFMKVVRQEWLARVDDEVRAASGLIEESQHVDLFDRYVTHVSYWVKKEKVFDRVTGKSTDPDSELMSQVERRLEVGEGAESYRRDLISAVAAYAIDHPGEAVDNLRIFARHIDRLRESFYAERSTQVREVAVDVLTHLDGDAGLDAERRARAERTLGVLRERFGYEVSSAREAIAELLAERYA